MLFSIWGGIIVKVGFWLSDLEVGVYKRILGDFNMCYTDGRGKGGFSF